MALTQPQLNAATFIRGLVDLTMINIDARYGLGAETMALVKGHIDGWDFTNRRELADVLRMVIAECRLPDARTEPEGERTEADHA